VSRASVASCECWSRRVWVSCNTSVRSRPFRMRRSLNNAIFSRDARGPRHSAEPLGRTNCRSPRSMLGAAQARRGAERFATRFKRLLRDPSPQTDLRAGAKIHRSFALRRRFRISDRHLARINPFIRRNCSPRSSSACANQGEVQHSGDNFPITTIRPRPSRLPSRLLP
jgi:hypothetical protein